MTKHEVEHWGRMYAIALDHRIKLDKIRREGAELTALLADIRRKEEDLTKFVINDRVHWARLSGKRASIADLQRYLDLKVDQDGLVIPEDAPYLQTWRADLEADARRLNVTITWERRCAGLNAYAWVALRKAEFAPPTSAGLYATGKHELGHHARPCLPSHRRVVTNPTLKRECCPECEVQAWRWAIETAKPRWTHRMHDRLSRSLSSYRKHAVDGSAVAKDIDVLVSQFGFRQAVTANKRRGVI